MSRNRDPERHVTAWAVNHAAEETADLDQYEHRRGIRRLGLQGQPVRIERCVCGGEVVCLRPLLEDDLVTAIRTHQQTLTHRAWRRIQDEDA